MNIFREFYLYPALIDLFLNKRKKESFVFLLGTPLHKNIGDHLISYHAKKFISSLHAEKNIVEIPTEIYTLFKASVKRYISPNDIIYISGGGWMGDVWPDDDFCMQDIISTFYKNKIVIMPQTLYFENPKNRCSEKLIQNAQRAYSKCNNLTLCLRDNLSYENALKYYNHSIRNIFFFPDMALYSDLCTQRIDKTGILLCLREDVENVHSHNLEKTICAYAMRHNLPINRTSTISNHGIPLWKRKSVIKAKSKEFSRAEIVVTDRLHGMIFAILSGSKCIAIDNKTHKVKGVYEKWLKSNKNVCLLENEKDIDTFLDENLKSVFNIDSQNEWRSMIDNEFNLMRAKLEEII